MFSHIEGRVEEKRGGELVIDVGGIGFLLNCSAASTNQPSVPSPAFSVDEKISI